MSKAKLLPRLRKILVTYATPCFPFQQFPRNAALSPQAHKQSFARDRVFASVCRRVLGHLCGCPPPMSPIVGVLVLSCVCLFRSEAARAAKKAEEEEETLRNAAAERMRREAAAGAAPPPAPAPAPGA